MPIIQGDAGSTLAANYDVEGSQISISELLAQDVNLVHEMGGQIFSERARILLVKFTSIATAASTPFVLEQGGIVDAPNRLLGFEAFGNNAGRVNNVSLAIRNTSTGREMPVWKWQTAVGEMTEIFVHWSDDGAAAGQTINYFTDVPFAAQMLLRADLLGNMPSLIMRGVTGAFGAGTQIVTGVATLLVPTSLNPGPGEPSSHGLPMPSW